MLGRKSKLNSHVPSLVGTTLVMLYYLYLNLTRSVLDIFNCQPTSPPDGHTYLRTFFITASLFFPVCTGVARRFLCSFFALLTAPPPSHTHFLQRSCSRIVT